MKKNYRVNNTTTVMDAIFLSEPDLYKQIASESDKNETEPFIATYILDPNPEIKKALLHVSEKLGCKLINLLDGAVFNFDKNEKALGLPGVKNLEVQDWLYYLINAKFVITDSYHGTCFSILFNKDFITIGNKIRGLTRFKMVLGLTKLENRFVFEPAEILENEKLLEPINYDYANKVLNIEIEKTRKWLLDALAAPKKIRFVEIVAILKRSIIARILKKLIIPLKSTSFVKLTSYFYLKIKEINKPKSQKPEQQD